MNSSKRVGRRFGGDDFYRNMTENDENCAALKHKERGNELFKSGKHESALEEYGAGLSALERSSSSSPSEVRLSLLLNRATCLSRLDRWQEAAECAASALDIDSSSVKASYRLGVANSRLGRLSAAQSELSKVLELEPSNKDAKRELLLVRQEMQARKTEEKKRIEIALKKGLYSDVEEERARRRQEDEAKMAVKRQRFAKANEERKASGEAELSFEDWIKKEEEKEKKEKEKREKEIERRQRERDEKRRLERLASSSDVVVVDDEEVDADCRGYKVLADGRKTSYFTQVPDDATREMLEKHSGPKKLDSTDDAQPISSQASSSGSAWNASGTTFEERSLTKWADEALKRHLESVCVECEGCSIKTSSVKKLEGEASIVFSRRVPKYIFDYVATLEWEATTSATSSSLFGGFMSSSTEKKPAEAEEKKYRGSVVLPELSSVVTDGMYEQRLSLKKSSSETNFREQHQKSIESYQAAIDAAIASFVEEYRKK